MGQYYVTDHLLSQPSSVPFHNARMKVFPSGYREILVCDKSVFIEPGWERDAPRRSAAASYTLAADESEDYPDGWALGDTFSLDDRRRRNLRRSAARAAGRVREIALCSDFTHFVTLTLDGAVIDRYDSAEIVRRMSRRLDNLVRRRGLAYLLVPERHKDGAIHFHGFVNGALALVDSGTVSLPGGKRPRRPRSRRQREEWLSAGGHAVYNIPEWPFGFTTAIELYGEPLAAISYVCKYIRKQMDTAAEKIGGRWYYHGGACGEPEIQTFDLSLEEAEQIAQYSFTIPEADCRYWRICIRPDGSIVEHMFDNRKE